MKTRTVKTPIKTRSEIMRCVKSANTTPEMRVRSLIYKLGYRYRLCRPELPGKPDIVFISKRKVIFVHGCYWHGHDCARGSRIPKTNTDYWVEKVTKNKTRDAANIASLQEQGWSVLVIWECELRDEDSMKNKIISFLEARI